MVIPGSKEKRKRRGRLPPKVQDMGMGERRREKGNVRVVNLFPVDVDIGISMSVHMGWWFMFSTIDFEHGCYTEALSVAYII